MERPDPQLVAVHEPVFGGRLLRHVAQVQLSALVPLVQSHVQGELPGSDVQKDHRTALLPRTLRSGPRSERVAGIRGTERSQDSSLPHTLVQGHVQGELPGSEVQKGHRTATSPVPLVQSHVREELPGSEVQKSHRTAPSPVPSLVDGQVQVELPR